MASSASTDPGRRHVPDMWSHTKSNDGTQQPAEVTAVSGHCVTVVHKARPLDGEKGWLSIESLFLFTFYVN